MLLLVSILGGATAAHGSSLEGPQILGEVGELHQEADAQEKEVFFASDLCENNEQLSLIRENLPRFAELPMTCIEQYPELPTGCEAVAMTTALQTMGYSIDKVEFASKYLIYNDEDMALGYLGDPFSYEGAGVFPPGLVMSANEYLKEQGSEIRAYEASGIGFENVLSFLSLGKPALIWVTMDYSEPWYEYEEDYEHDHGGPEEGHRRHKPFEEFQKEEHYDYEYEGHYYSWYLNEHCVCLKGYDLDEGLVTICDPLNGELEMDLEEVKALYDRIGGYGVVFY